MGGQVKQRLLIRKKQMSVTTEQKLVGNQRAHSVVHFASVITMVPLKTHGNVTVSLGRFQES